MDLFLLLVGLALAVPPSSTLSGENGTLSWQVQVVGDQVVLQGDSHKWRVQHTAKADWTPVSTVRTNPDGTVVRITYAPDGAVVRMPDGKERRHQLTGLWDGDTLDVRLGAEAAAGRFGQVFSAIDTGSGKVYQFDAKRKGQEQPVGDYSSP
jgi:hypothetical protein